MKDYANNNDYQKDKIDKIQSLLNPLKSDIEFVWVGESSRRRVTFQVDYQNKLGFFKEKSHQLIEITEFKIAEEKINLLIKPLKNFLKKISQNLVKQIVVTSFDNGLDIVLNCQKAPPKSDEIKFINFAKENALNFSYLLGGRDLIPVFLLRNNQIFCNEIKLNVASDVFLQATKSGLEIITDFLRKCILETKNSKFNNSKVKNNFKVADLYCGFGIYSFSLIDTESYFDCFEGSESMINIIKNNANFWQLSNKINALKRDLYTYPLNAIELKKYDNIIINPPRNGAEPQIRNIVNSQVKSLQYISCNPQTFLRDARILIDSKYTISKIVALDQFYSTKHHEILAHFIKK